MIEFNGKKFSNITEYENYIKNLVYSYEDKLSDQKERIFSLVEENKKLYIELKEFKDKDSQISKALMVALQKAKEIEEAAKEKYNMEIERLKLFHHKWISYYEKIKKIMPIDENMLTAEEFLNKMDNILGLQNNSINKDNNDAMLQFLDETKRLEKQNKDIDESAVTLSPDNKLDMNEVLNPQNLPELDELIKQMGILDK